MCGIVGYIAKSQHVEAHYRDKFMERALVWDEVRGYDSTGIMSVEGQFEVSRAWGTMPGSAFVGHEVYDSHTRDGWASFGHNRAATRGKVSLDNCHPFLAGDIVLMHNGTLQNKGANLPAYDSKVEVDSNNIAIALNAVAPKQAKDVLAKLRGSFALVWMDKRDSTVNICRNEKRPLHFSVSPTKNFMTFMSDGRMLQLLSKYLTRGDFMTKDIFSLEPLVHLKFKRGSFKPEVVKIVPEKVTYQGTGHYGGYGGGAANNNTARQRADKKWHNRTCPVVTSYDVDKLIKAVPKSEIAELKEFFELDTEHRLEFVPDEFVPIQNGEYLVTGSIQHPEWGNMEWDAEAIKVPAPLLGAVRSRSWTVRPLGCGRPVNNSILQTGNGQLVSVRCCVEDYKYAKPTSYDDPEPKHTEMIEGFGRKNMIYGYVKKRIENGCVNCGLVIPWQEAGEAEYANECRDIVCGDCKWNYDGGGK